MKKRWMAAAAVSLCLTFGCYGTAVAADGQWLSTEQGWKYEKTDGTFSGSGWEDINGEWYYFDKGGVMQTGWQKIGNQRYFLQDNGALARGWQYCDENSAWYYFDTQGNSKTGWLLDNGKWYYFNSNGTLNTSSSKEIDGERFYFYEDGALRANEYRGFKYIDWEGRLNADYDITAVNNKDKKASVDADVKDEIAEEVNELPKGWLKKFVDDGWKFIYCPEKEYYSSSRFEDSGERYYIRYKIDTYRKTLRFTERDAIRMGFGEYIYQAARTELRDTGFTDEVSWSVEEIRDITEMPEYYDKDYQTVFGALFARYTDESYREEIKSNLPDIARILETVINSRGYDGKPVAQQ